MVVGAGFPCQSGMVLGTCTVLPLTITVMVSTGGTAGAGTGARVEEGAAGADIGNQWV